MRKDALAAAAVFLLLFAVYVASPNATSFDSRWTIYTALSLLHRGDVDLNEYLPLLERDGFYAIECLLPDGRRILPVQSAAGCPGGRFVTFYPVAVPLLAAPAVFAIETSLRAAQPVLRPVAGRMPTEARRNFLLADLAGCHALVELLVASFIVALAGAVMFLVARGFLSLPLSLLAAFLFGLATPAWSTGSRALWQHGPSMLLLALALLALSRGRRWVAWAGVPLSVAFFVRPSNAVSVLVFSIYIWVRHRDRFPAFLAAMVPASLLFTAFNLTTYGTVLTSYSRVTGGPTPGLGLHDQLAEAALAHLFSPSRGVLVFSPVFLLALAGMRQARRFPLAAWAAGAILLHWLLLSIYRGWMGGHSYGPRYMSDVTPHFVYLLLPFLDRISAPGPHRAVLTAAFVVLSSWSVLVHQQGAMRWETMEWNVCPADIGSQTWRLWDWRDPQFLRGLRSGIPRCTPG
jgi:hypothetical protein